MRANVRFDHVKLREHVIKKKALEEGSTSGYYMHQE
jgi:hypothetical protein